MTFKQCRQAAREMASEGKKCYFTLVGPHCGFRCVWTDAGKGLFRRVGYDRQLASHYFENEGALCEEIGEKAEVVRG